VCREDDRGNVEHLWETGGAEDPTTNNRMELRAALEGLLKLAELPGVRNVNVRVLSDSKYVIGAMTLWVRNWKRNGWKTNSHEPVKNQDLIEELDQLQNWFHNFPTWVWVKGQRERGPHRRGPRDRKATSPFRGSGGPTPLLGWRSGRGALGNSSHEARTRRAAGAPRKTPDHHFGSSGDEA